MDIQAIRPLADSAITVDLAHEVGPYAAASVGTAVALLNHELEAGTLPGVTEITRAFCSVTLHYDALDGSHEALATRIADILAPAVVDAGPTGRAWRLPCCYCDEYGTDLAALAARLSLPRDEVVRLHRETTFSVHALGFLPGLPFMGGLPEALNVPRRTEPRVRVPAGSVAIANGLCVIYPWECPGGWHIVGRCPIPLFDVSRPSPALLDAGDTVRFEPVSAARMREIEDELARSAVGAAAFMEAEKP